MATSWNLTEPRPLIPKLTPNKRLCCVKEKLCLRCRRHGHQKKDCPNFPQTSRGITSRTSTDPTPCTPKLSSRERENCSLKGLCFRCRRKGHRALSCSFPPEPSKPSHFETSPTENSSVNETPELLETEENDDEEIPHTSPLADSIDQMFPKIPQ